MILSPLTLVDVPAALQEFRACLDDAPFARRVFQRIADTLPFVIGNDIELSLDRRHCAEAVGLLARFGMATIDRAPTEGLTWDGQAVAINMEPSVVIHEVAHFQLAAPKRRHLPDFGVGAGPETGDRAAAEAAQCLTGVAREVEEALVSLLGILWEAELGQPAVLAFLEQNWLEGGANKQNRRHFVRVAEHLRDFGFLDADGRPTMALRNCDDSAFFASFLA